MTFGRCIVQGCCTPWDRVQADHFIPLSEGGDRDGPGVAMCHTHHQRAHGARDRMPLRIDGREV